MTDNTTTKIKIRFIYKGEKYFKGIDSNQGYTLTKAPTDGFLIQQDTANKSILFVNLKMLNLARQTREDGIMKFILLNPDIDF